MIFPWRAFIDNQPLPTQKIKPGRLEKIKLSNTFELIKSRRKVPNLQNTVLPSWPPHLWGDGRVRTQAGVNLLKWCVSWF